MVPAQLIEDGTYPNAGAVLAEGMDPEWVQSGVADFSPDQPRDPDGRWAAGGGVFPAGPLSGSSVLREQTGFVGPSAPSVAVAGDPTAGEPPEEEIEREKKEAERKDRERIDLNAGFKPRPDGTIEPPKMLPMTPPDQTPEAVLRGFAGPKSMRTWQNQMIKRGWTASQIEEAIQSGKSFEADNRVYPGNGATRYVHPDTGRSVVVDSATGKVIQLQGGDFKND